MTIIMTEKLAKEIKDGLSYVAVYKDKKDLFVGKKLIGTIELIGIPKHIIEVIKLENKELGELLENSSYMVNSE